MKNSNPKLRGIPIAYFYNEPDKNLILHLRSGPGIVSSGAVWRILKGGHEFKQIPIGLNNESVETVLLHESTLVCRTAVRKDRALSDTAVVEYDLVEDRIVRRLGGNDFITLIPSFERAEIYAILQPTTLGKKVYALVHFGSRCGFLEAWIVAIESRLRLVERTTTLFW